VDAVVASPAVRRNRVQPLDGEPIRILRVIARLNVGGPALHVAYLSAELDRLGYKTILAAGTVSPGEGSMEDIARANGVEPVVIRDLQREIQFVSDIKVAWRLRKLIRETRPHVLHTHTAKAGAVGRVAAALSGDARPLVLVHTFHGHVLRGYFGPVRTWVFARLERRLAALSDALVAVSPQVRDELAALRVAPAARIAVIRLGLDLEQRTAAKSGARVRMRAELGIGEDQFVVAWLGRMTEIKRVDHLLHAFARLEADAVLMLAGDGPLRPQLEQLAASLGITERCCFIGYVNDVGAIYQTADAIALTSANEGTPVTLIEASAAGRPVISTDVGGVADVVNDGETGYLVPRDDVTGLTARMTQLARDPALRERLGAAGAEHVRLRYAVPRLVSDVDRLYQSLLALRAPTDHRTFTALSRPLTPTLRDVPSTPTATRRLRIILISQYFPPEVGATQSRIQAFAEHLHAQGHDVTVISEFPNHPHGVIPQRYSGRFIEDDRSNGYRTLRVWVRTSPEKTQSTRMALYLSFMGMASAVAPIAGRCDVVVATSPPLFVGAAGLAIAKMSGAPLVLDIRDLWPAAAVSLEQISWGATKQAAVALEHFLYRRAHVVTAVTRPFCQHIDAIRARGPATVLLPNGTLELFFDGNGGPSARAELGGDSERFLVTFAGTHGIAQALPSVLDAAALSHDLADFVFVGDGPAKDHLMRQAAEQRVTNAFFHPQVPLDSVPRLLASSDALLVPLSGHPVFADFVPSKMIDFMAVGKPILLSARGEAARILELAGAGIAVPPEDPAALAEAVRRLAVDPAGSAEMGRRGRDFAARRLRSVQAVRLEELLLDIVPTSSNR
jgi:glycosyltransferase involved in cell wall biosynthesis